MGAILEIFFNFAQSRVGKFYIVYHSPLQYNLRENSWGGLEFKHA